MIPGMYLGLFLVCMGADVVPLVAEVLAEQDRELRLRELMLDVQGCHTCLHA